MKMTKRMFVLDALLVTSLAVGVINLALPDKHLQAKGFNVKQEAPITVVASVPVKAELSPAVDSSTTCDCEFAGLQIVTADVQKVYLDKDKKTILADTTGEVLGNYTVTLTPQHNENFEQMVQEYQRHEICIGFVGDATKPETVEVTWALLSSVD
jgi:dihydroxyacid dehydratase/phosphogluconate dehydratase